jgi:hypothetical protein
MQPVIEGKTVVESNTFDVAGPKPIVELIVDSKPGVKAKAIAEPEATVDPNTIGNTKRFLFGQLIVSTSNFMSRYLPSGDNFALNVAGVTTTTCLLSCDNFTLWIGL